MNIDPLGKNLDVLPQNSKNFLTNPNDNHKNRCHSKITLDHVFQLFSESTFSFKFS